MKYKALLCDLDGTLLDTLGDLNNSVNYALIQCGFMPRDISHTRKTLGNGIKNLVYNSCPPDTDDITREKVFGLFTEHYPGNCDILTRPYDGIVQALNEIKGKGVHISVVSNKSHALVEKLCGEFFPGLIGFCAGECERYRRKPDPVMVFAALESMGVKPTEALYIGDSEVDILTAGSACVPFAAVSWGFRERDFLIEKGADLIFDSPSDLKGYLF